MPIDMSDEAARKRRIWLEMTDEAFMLWRHDRVTQGFMQLIADANEDAFDGLLPAIEKVAASVALKASP